MNSTIENFGYPDTLLAEFEHWVVLLRPMQATLGAMVLAAKSDATRYADLPAEAFGEMKVIVSQIEAALDDAFQPQKYNYLMLMMVDPHVHYHVLPRYDGDQDFEGTTFKDEGWPALPDLTKGVAVDATLRAALKERLIPYFST